jgi:hypothetical protein
MIDYLELQWRAEIVLSMIILQLKARRTVCRCLKAKDPFLTGTSSYKESADNSILQTTKFATGQHLTVLRSLKNYMGK